MELLREEEKLEIELQKLCSDNSAASYLVHSGQNNFEQADNSKEFAQLFALEQDKVEIVNQIK